MSLFVFPTSQELHFLEEMNLITSDSATPLHLNLLNFSGYRHANIYRGLSYI